MGRVLTPDCPNCGQQLPEEPLKVSCLLEAVVAAIVERENVTEDIARQWLAKQDADDLWFTRFGPLLDIFEEEMFAMQGDRPTEEED